MSYAVRNQRLQYNEDTVEGQVQEAQTIANKTVLQMWAWTAPPPHISLLKAKYSFAGCCFIAVHLLHKQNKLSKAQFHYVLPIYYIKHFCHRFSFSLDQETLLFQTGISPGTIFSLHSKCIHQLNKCLKLSHSIYITACHAYLKTLSNHKEINTCSITDYFNLFWQWPHFVFMDKHRQNNL